MYFSYIVYNREIHFVVLGCCQTKQTDKLKFWAISARFNVAK